MKTVVGQFPSCGAAMACLLLSLAACGGGGSGGGSATPAVTAVPVAAAATTGSGTLQVSVTDTDGDPILGAWVWLDTADRSRRIGVSFTDAEGLASFESLPPRVAMRVQHEFGGFQRYDAIDVAQVGTTRFALKMDAQRPSPTIALLPVTIPPGSVSADRRELLLKISVVAAATTPFTLASYGEFSPDLTPSLSLVLGDPSGEGSARLCDVWLDRKRTRPACENLPWPRGTNPYTASVEQFAYDDQGRVPNLAAATPVGRSLLLMDQSERVAALDPALRRSIAMRGFVKRVTTGGGIAAEAAVLGFAADRSDPPARALLPQQPLWSPLGALPWSADPVALATAIDELEPLAGGAAPVFRSLDAALALLVAQGDGRKALVAVLGGDDEEIADPGKRATTLAALRRARDASGVLSILVDGSADRDASLAIAELATALRAPVVALPVRSVPDRESQPWSAGIHSALQLAAQLVDATPLRSLSATFRVRTSAATGFVSGTTLRGSIITENDVCPMGCGEVSQEFVVTIP